MKISTEFVYPPIPLRHCDWSAVDSDTFDGPGSLIGWGATEQEAVQDLLRLIADRLPDLESEECSILPDTGV